MTDIESVFALLRDSFGGGKKLLLCGNGGSASDAEHWAGELLKAFAIERPLSPEELSGLPADFEAHLQWALPAIPLTGFPSFSSAYCNDVSAEYVYAQLVNALGEEGDVLAVLSTSGNSPNVLRAAQVARARKIRVVALTGATGGRLKDMADICIRVPATQTPLVQEFHLPIYHCLSLMLEEYFGEKRK